MKRLVSKMPEVGNCLGMEMSGREMFGSEQSGRETSWNPHTRLEVHLIQRKKCPNYFGDT